MWWWWLFFDPKKRRSPVQNLNKSWCNLWKTWYVSEFGTHQSISIRMTVESPLGAGRLCVLSSSALPAFLMFIPVFAYSLNRLSVQLIRLQCSAALHKEMGSVVKGKGTMGNINETLRCPQNGLSCLERFLFSLEDYQLCTAFGWCNREMPCETKMSLLQQNPPWSASIFR